MRGIIELSSALVAGTIYDALQAEKQKKNGKICRFFASKNSFLYESNVVKCDIFKNIFIIEPKKIKALQFCDFHRNLPEKTRDSKTKLPYNKLVTKINQLRRTKMQTKTTHFRSWKSIRCCSSHRKQNDL